MTRTIAMMFALRALFAPSPPAIVVPDLATLQQEIAKVADAGVKAMLASDAAAVDALYLENAIELPSCRPLIVMLERTGGDWKIAYAIHNIDRPSMMPRSGAGR